MKTLKHENKQKIQFTQERVNVLKLQVNDLLKRFAEMPNGKLKDNKTLSEVLTNPKNAYRNIIKSLIPDTDCGLPVDKEAKLRLMTFPDFSELTEMHDKLRMDARQYEIDHINSGIFELESETNVRVNNSAKELLFDRFRVFATTKTEDKFMDLHLKFIQSFNEFKEYSFESFGSNNAPQFNFNEFQLHKFITDGGEVNTDLFKTLQVHQK